VQAANSDGIWGAPKKLLALTVVPAWYQTAWFKIGAVLLFITAVYAFYRQRLLEEQAKHLAEKRAAELRQREAELKQIKTEFEKQLAETEMAALRSQMNPHFIFNVLNSINRYILSNDKNAASAYLVQFSRLIRLTLENSKAAKVSLQADLEALRIYIEMEKLRFGNQFTYSVEVEEGIDPQFIQIPPLLIQPYVENAIWHGLMQKDSPGRLLVQVTQPDDNLLKVVVQDNGIGRDQAAALKSKSATAHKSYGLQITSDRLRIVNRLHGVQATATVEDLYDVVQQPAGTKVTLLIPV
jgi:LytS/YehU family sensor histidine kinase